MPAQIRDASTCETTEAGVEGMNTGGCDTLEPAFSLTCRADVGGGSDTIQEWAYGRHISFALGLSHFHGRFGTPPALEDPGRCTADANLLPSAATPCSAVYSWVAWE